MPPDIFPRRSKYGDTVLKLLVVFSLLAGFDFVTHSPTSFTGGMCRQKLSIVDFDVPPLMDRPGPSRSSQSRHQGLKKAGTMASASASSRMIMSSLASILAAPALRRTYSQRRALKNEHLEEFEAVANAEYPRVIPDRASVKVAVFGSGRFGTALGSVIARNGYSVTMLTRQPETVESINTKHVNPLIPDHELPALVNATMSCEEALRGVSFIVHTIPVQSSEGFIEKFRDLIPPHVPIISCSKGLHTDTLETMADLIPRVLGRPQPMAFLSGPTFADELLDGYPSGFVLASEDAQLAERCTALFNCAAIRCYTSSDVIGVEMGGALKNVYALIAGAAEGLGFGVNTIAFLVTRACTEMNLLSVAMGAQAHTMAGLAGVGDLMLTCMGGASRNKAVGKRIGAGESVESVLESREETLAGVAEGVATAPAAAKLAKKLGVEAPLINIVVNVLEGKQKIPQALYYLMTDENEFKSDFSKAAHVVAKRKRRRIFR